MKRISIVVFVLLNIVACQSTPTQKIAKKKGISKKANIMEEYREMKAKLEPQGYIITTDSVSKVFIDHAVTIDYHEKKK